MGRGIRAVAAACLVSLPTAIVADSVRWRAGPVGDHALAGWVDATEEGPQARLEVYCQGPRVVVELHADPPPGAAVFAVDGRAHRLPPVAASGCACGRFLATREGLHALRTGTRLVVGTEAATEAPTAPAFSLRASDAAIEIATFACAPLPSRPAGWSPPDLRHGSGWRGAFDPGHGGPRR